MHHTFYFPSSVCSATSLPLLHYSHKPQVILWAYSGSDAVFLFWIHCPLCLRAGDLSQLNHQVTFSFSPKSQLILMGRENIEFSLTVCWKPRQNVHVCSTRYSSSPAYFALFQHSFTPTRSLCRAKAGVALIDIYSHKFDKAGERLADL